VKDYFYENMVELDSWSESWKENLKEKGFGDADLSYSLGYSQGDGASFTTKSVDIEKVVKSSDKLKKFKKFVDDNGDNINVSIDRSGSMYVHENSTRAHIEVYDKELTQEQEKTLDEFQDALNEVIYDLNKEITKSGYDEIEYETSDEYIDEMSEANEYEYLEDGKMFHK